MEEKALIEILKSRTNLKLKNKSSNLEKANEIISRDFTLFHIEELTFEEKSPRKEAFENVLSSLRIEGVTFVYLLMGDKNGVHFYLGIARDKSYKQDLALDVKDIGKSILKASVEGNFRGSKIRIQGKDAKKDIQDKMSNMSSFAKISGVPNENIDSEDFQGVDRLVDVMAGDEFVKKVYRKVIV
ncbi:MAG: hypothetical protein B6229_04520 [Spirochaetaceae bacterium 4572_7]|nr:MAG: hypothetical protein B6229_04520 [Spirochaetaceae bacterium 4572_7]